MHRTAGSHSLSHGLVELSERLCCRTSYERALRSHRRLRTHPDDVIDVHIISVKAFFRTVKVENRRKVRLVNTPEIKEITVLTELVIIAAVVGSSIDIAKEYGDSASALSCSWK